MISNKLLGCAATKYNHLTLGLQFVPEHLLDTLGALVRTHDKGAVSMFLHFGQPRQDIMEGFTLFAQTLFASNQINFQIRGVSGGQESTSIISTSGYEALLFQLFNQSIYFGSIDAGNVAQPKV
jgi:hypothetical protein